MGRWRQETIKLYLCVIGINYSSPETCFIDINRLKISKYLYVKVENIYIPMPFSFS